MNHEHTERLSAAARARMERDLPALRARVTHTPSRRLFRRAAGALACLVLLLVAARTLPAPGAPRPSGATMTHLPPDGAHDTSPAHGEVTRGAIRTVIAPAPRQTRMLDDAELLRTLAEAGRADGIIRTKGRTHLASELTHAYAEVTSPRLP
ncbi:MAG: hypothetical protein DYG92_06380 [Leptolyngbya sp. PLA1]|nr:hypothetical protein [Leptolyngbya sp. PLA1]